MRKVRIYLLKKRRKSRRKTHRLLCLFNDNNNRQLHLGISIDGAVRKRENNELTKMIKWEIWQIWQMDFGIDIKYLIQ